MDKTTHAERISDRELVAARNFNAPARLVFEAWTKPELMMQWWTPKSFGITFVSCEIDARTGGSYKFVFSHPGFDEPMAFFGRYIEVLPPTRIVWTNQEEVDGALTTVSFEENDGKTRVTVHDLYPSKEALDAAIASGSTGAWPEQFAELDNLLARVGT
jgi:uncharacterized protein YndB with AHSA1/START domain